MLSLSIFFSLYILFNNIIYLFKKSLLFALKFLFPFSINNKSCINNDNNILLLVLFNILFLYLKFVFVIKLIREYILGK